MTVVELHFEPSLNWAHVEKQAISEMSEILLELGMQVDKHGLLACSAPPCFGNLFASLRMLDAEAFQFPLLRRNFIVNGPEIDASNLRRSLA
ncbi:Hypothetical Protein FCC1311_086462 [Hondaea fermentalgiana]|uniref:Uncharacterized protein n=1 Tax=Hondaea fermentalgiana TaxID=2315210 RepID=A0A2R5GVJ1_9STRA|nr:Hypothetical Protein FCC1311_086462 [Hondaea fermentalgiana]|eukprot:GBG32421.1 Hypothetical Protein FCC1311_086462 [Hondaea fermentalgiana]